MTKSHLNGRSVMMGLAVLSGSHSEAMGVAVIIRDKELGLSVIAIHYFRNCVTLLRKALSERLNVVRRPVESYTLVILRLGRRTSSFIEPEIQPLVMNHASDESTILPHGTIHGQPNPVHPDAQTLPQTGAGYDWNARFNQHTPSCRLTGSA